MKLNINEHDTIEASGCSRHLEFGIKTKDMGIILDILRSKMYKNPIAAICREITSNARDANRESGNQTKPIEISINKSSLTPGDITISFSDCGPGISPDRMADVFVNYGASTKRDTNTQTGAFGLGAKTPFAYSDTFSIVTKVDKVCYTYITAIEKNNTGKIFLAKEEKTSEQNGTSIIIPIKQEDLRTFEQEIIKTTMFWKVRPILKDFSSSFFDSKCHDKMCGCDIFYSQSYSFLNFQSVNLLIDEIPYKLDLEILDEVPEFSTLNLFLPFKTGVLSISANREAVQYDKKTIELIKKKFSDFCDDVKKSIEKEISECSSYFEACAKVEKYKNKFLYPNLKRDIQYKNQVIKSEFKFQHLVIFKVTQSGKTVVHKIEESMIENPIFFLDKMTLSKSKSSAVLEKNDMFYIIEYNHKELKKFFSLSFEKKKAFVKLMRQAIKELKYLQQIGLTYSKYSEIKGIKTQSSSRLKPLERMYVKKVLHSHYSSLKFTGEHLYTEEVIKQPEKYAYYVYEVINTIDQDIQNWAYLLTYGGKNEKANTVVLFILKKYEKVLEGKIPTLRQAIDLYDKKKLQEFSDKQFLRTNSYESKYDLHNLEKMSGLFLNGYEKKLKFIQTVVRGTNCAFIPSDILQKVPPSSEIKDAIEKLNEMYIKYPLLKYCDNHSDKQSFREYIKLIDDSKKLGEKNGII